MSHFPEINVRLFDSIDGESSLLIGEDAHDALFSQRLARVLKRSGFDSRKVANTLAITEIQLVTDYHDYATTEFPADAIDSTNAAGDITMYQANVGLEITPPIDTATIKKIGPLIANLLHNEKSDFYFHDERGEHHKVYTQPYSAHIIQFPER